MSIDLKQSLKNFYIRYFFNSWFNNFFVILGKLRTHYLKINYFIRIGISIVIMLTLLFLVVMHKRNENKSFINDKSLTNYAIGTITSFSGRHAGFVGGTIHSSPQSSNVHFTYFVNGTKIENFDWGVPEIGQKEGDKFLVIYYISHYRFVISRTISIDYNYVL